MATDLSGQTYSKTSSIQYSKGLELVEKLDIQPGQTVLDIGCGTGELTAYIASKVGENGKVLGIDPDKDRIDFAIKKYESISNLTFLHAGIREFPQEDFYDVVFSNAVFHWISNKDLEDSLGKLYDALKAGGVVGIQCIAILPGNMSKSIACLPAEIQKEIFSKLRVRKGEVFEKIFKTAGFTDVIWEVNKDSKPLESFTFKDKDKLFSMLFCHTQGLIDIRKASQEKLEATEWETTNSGEIHFIPWMIKLLAKK